MRDAMLLVTDLDAFFFACGQEDAAATWTSEREEQARLQAWETLGETDMVAYCRGRLSLLAGAGSQPAGRSAAGTMSGADQGTRTVLAPALDGEVG